MERPSALAVTDSELSEANHREYDRGVDPLLVLAVYEPIHGGWQLTNIGGRSILDFILERLGPRADVLELCAGLADTGRYLATHGDCSVTGIELNRQQVEAGLQRLAAEPELAGRIRLIEGDVLSWEPDRPYDAVFGMDALMMLRGVEEALAAALRALRPGGLLFLAEIMAGPRLTDADRQYLWDESGIVSLPSPEEYTRLLERAGFTRVEVADLTGQAVGFFERVRSAVEERQERFLEVGGDEGYRKWLDLADRYGALFRGQHLAYGLVTAIRPGERPGARQPD